MGESNTSHAAAVAVGIAAGANDKMLGHTAMLEANAQRTTLNVHFEFRISKDCRNAGMEPMG